MFKGGELEGNVCFDINSSDLGSLVLYDKGDVGDEERLFFELPKTQTPVACPTQQEQTYFLSVATLAREVIPNSEGFARQNRLVSNDPVVITQRDWKAKTALYLANMQLYVSAVKDLSAPPSVKHIHELYLKSVDALQSAIDFYTYGLDNLDGDAILESGAYFGEHARLVAEASEVAKNHCK